jgi:outer membrane protein OmpA-like peptidoglycan-associated protein
MTGRLVPTLVLSVAIAIPACAQQSDSAGSTAQTSPADQAREPLPSSTPHDFWDGDDPNFGNLILHPFARKAWVKRQIDPIKDRVNELDEISDSNRGHIKDIDSRTQQGLQLASDKVALADQHTADAAGRAQTAQNAATQASTRISNEEQVVGNLDQYKSTGQTEILFRPGETVLSKSAKDALDAMAAPLKDQHGYIIEVHGFASGHGQAAISSSEKMADSVLRYLVLTHNIPPYRIYILSMGDAPIAADTGSAGHIRGGKVEVSVMKNDLGSSAQR